MRQPFVAVRDKAISLSPFYGRAEKPFADVRLLIILADKALKAV